MAAWPPKVLDNVFVISSKDIVLSSAADKPTPSFPKPAALPSKALPKAIDTASKLLPLPAEISKANPCNL